MASSLSFFLILKKRKIEIQMMRIDFFFSYVFDDADETEGRSAVDNEIFWPQDEHVRN
jgi:hypothetical protein